MADAVSKTCCVISIFKSSTYCVLLVVLSLFSISYGIFGKRHATNVYDMCGLICFYQNNNKNIGLCPTIALYNVMNFFGFILNIFVESIHDKCRNSNTKQKLCLFACFISATMFSVILWTFLYNTWVVLFYITNYSEKLYYMLLLFLIIGQFICWIFIHESYIKRLIKFQEALRRKEEACNIPLLQEHTSD